jgi:hypothetical protein
MVERKKNMVHNIILYMLKGPNMAKGGVNSLLKILQTH